jgi:hypothetical protein
MRRRREFLSTVAAAVVGLAGCTDGVTDGTTTDAATGTAGTAGADTSRASPTATLTPTTGPATATTPDAAAESETSAVTEGIPRLVPDDGQGGDFFGASVAVDGETALVGASYDDTANGTQSGSAYVFVREDGAWSRQAKLLADDGDTDDWFGTSVTLDGDTAIVGAVTDEDPNGSGYRRLTGAGSAYVFERTDGSWSQQAKLFAADGDSSDAFGLAVTLDGDTALVGAPSDEDPNGVSAGSAYVFERADGAWTQRAKLAPDDGDDADRFGTGLAFEDATAVISAPGDEDPNGDGAGSAYVFERTDDAWTQQAKLAPDDGDDGDNFGWDVDLSGDTALVGAYTDDDPNGEDAGSAYAFTRSDGSWSQAAKLAPDDGDDGDRFGHRVALAGDTALVGAYTDEDPNGTKAGSAYVFDRTDGTWDERIKLYAIDGDEGDYFGGTLALDDGLALLGAYTDEDPNGDDVGAVYVFEL